eukprot:3185248-Alexandrium_andersonii.AAC.1
MLQILAAEVIGNCTHTVAWPSGQNWPGPPKSTLSESRIPKMQNGLKRAKLELRGSRKDLR